MNQWGHENSSEAQSALLHNKSARKKFSEESQHGREATGATSIYGSLANTILDKHYGYVTPLKEHEDSRMGETKLAIQQGFPTSMGMDTGPGCLPPFPSISSDGSQPFNPPYLTNDSYRQKGAGLEHPGDEMFRGPEIFRSSLVDATDLTENPQLQESISDKLQESSGEINMRRTLRQGSVSSNSSASSTGSNSKGLKLKGPVKRSRMGCLTCRKRKKRCCENRPVCLECSKLGLTCVWPRPGTEHKNKSRDSKDDDTVDHEIYGKIKVLRGIVEYRSE